MRSHTDRLYQALCDVVGKLSPPLIAHQPEQLTRLAAVIVVLGIVGPDPGLLHHRQRRPCQSGLGHGRALAGPVVGIEVDAAILIVRPAPHWALAGHGPIALIMEHRAAGCIDRDLIGVAPDAVPMGVLIGQQTRLEHLGATGVCTLRNRSVTR